MDLRAEAAADPRKQAWLEWHLMCRPTIPVAPNDVIFEKQDYERRIAEIMRFATTLHPSVLDFAKRWRDAERAGQTKRSSVRI